MRTRLLVAAALVAVVPVPADASVRVLPRAEQCAGQTLVVSADRAMCTHRDVYTPASDGPWRGVAPATAPLPCYGDGTTGARVHLFYGYVEGSPNRSALVSRMIRTQTAPRIQAVVRAASKGQDLGLRFLQAPGCGPVVVTTVKLPRAAATGTPEQRLTRVVEVLQALGHTRNDRKYHLLLDHHTDEGVCGLGEVLPDMDQPQPLNVHDGVPTQGARTDLSSTLPSPVPKYSTTWRSTFGPRGPNCWELGQSKAEVQLHEVLHTLGAVQLSAPHSDGGAHCTDTPSVMCPAPRKPTVPSCATQRVQVLDCRFDDYWDPAPAPGSYLDSSANIARSPFFGPQPQDDLVASPL